MTLAEQRCGKKVRFSSEFEAEKEIIRIQSLNSKKKKKRKVPVRHYECNICGFYHLTKRPDFKRAQDVELVFKSEWDILLEKQKENG